MITVELGGRLLQNCFRYCAGRILAEHLDYQLDCAPLPIFPSTLEKLQGRAYYWPVTSLDGHEFRDMLFNTPIRSLPSTELKGRLLLKGTFDYAPYFIGHEAVIKGKWLRSDYFDKFAPSPHRTIIIARTNHSAKLVDPPLEATLTILKGLKPDSILLLTTEYSPEFIEYSANLGLQFSHHNDVLSEVDLLSVSKSAATILTGIYAEGWWASFLSNATKVIFIRRCVGPIVLNRPKRRYRVERGESQMWQTGGRYIKYLFNSHHLVEV